MSSTVRTSSLRALVGATLATIMLASIGLAQPASAVAAPKKARTITRQKVISRAKHWVASRVPYSQSRYHQGYRQDCSGFVSMAWQMGTSYTTRSLPSVGRRISLKQVRAGDAVLAPGHVTIFGGWKNRSKRQYYAFEEPTWGKHATRRVRVLPSGAKILRRPGIVDKRKVARKKAKPKPVAVAPAVKLGARTSYPSTTTLAASPSVASSALTPTY